MKILSKKVQKNIWDRSMGISKKRQKGKFLEYILALYFVSLITL